MQPHDVTLIGVDTIRCTFTKTIKVMLLFVYITIFSIRIEMKLKMYRFFR